MYKYSFSSEDTDKITEKTKNYSDLLSNFKKVDEKYNFSDNQDLDLQQKTFQGKTDDEIKKQAQDSLQDYKQTGINDIEKSYDDKKSNLDKEIQLAKDSGEEKKKETSSLYSSLKEDAKQDALKRGLARSSIVINMLDAFDKNMLNEYKKINDDITSKIQNLSSQKSLLDEQKQNALNSFDISYALKLSNKIDEVNEKLKQEEQKILEYNNEIAEKEAEYKSKQKDKALSYATYIEKYGKGGINTLKQDEKVAYAEEYLMGLSKDEAIDELNNNKVFISELGPANYTKLKQKMLSRK